MFYDCLGKFKRFDLVGWSDRVLRWVRRTIRRGPNTSGEDMPDIMLESLRWGGSYILEGGSRKGGFGRTPRTPPPPWLRACCPTDFIIGTEQTVSCVRISFEYPNSSMFTLDTVYKGNDINGIYCVYTRWVMQGGCVALRAISKWEWRAHIRRFTNHKLVIHKERSARKPRETPMYEPVFKRSRLLLPVTALLIHLASMWCY